MRTYRLVRESAIRRYALELANERRPDLDIRQVSLLLHGKIEQVIVEWLQNYIDQYPSGLRRLE